MVSLLSHLLSSNVQETCIFETSVFFFFFQIRLKCTDRYRVLGCDLWSKVVSRKMKGIHKKKYHILYVH